MHSCTIPIIKDSFLKNTKYFKEIHFVVDYSCTAVKFQSNTFFLKKKTIEQYQFDTNLLSSREKYFNVMCNIKIS